MLFQCSARLTLIWLSGSALLPCQPVRGMVKLFEGGLSWGVACLCQAETRLRGCKTSVCSQPSHTNSPSPSLFFTPAGFSFPASAPSVSGFFLLPLSFPSLLRSLSLSHPCRDSHKHTHMHSFPPLSLWSLIKGIMTVRFGGSSDSAVLLGFSPNY